MGTEGIIEYKKRFKVASYSQGSIVLSLLNTVEVNLDITCSILPNVKAKGGKT